MSEQAVVEANNIIAPHFNKICVINVTTSSVRFDLSTLMNSTNLPNFVGPQCDELAGILTLVAEGGIVYFFLNNADSGTVDEAAHSGSSPDNSAMMIPDGGRMDFRLSSGFFWLVVKGSAPAKLRIYRSSASGAGTVPH